MIIGIDGVRHCAVCGEEAGYRHMCKERDDRIELLLRKIDFNLDILVGCKAGQSRANALRNEYERQGINRVIYYR